MTARVLDSVAQILAEAHEVEIRLASAGGGEVPALARALDDVRAQFAGLIYPGFIALTGASRLRDLVRYLRRHRTAAGQGSQRSRPETQNGWQSCSG